jgi:hypothetical protein
MSAQINPVFWRMSSAQREVHRASRPVHRVFRTTHPVACISSNAPRIAHRDFCIASIGVCFRHPQQAATCSLATALPT